MTSPTKVIFPRAQGDGMDKWVSVDAEAWGGIVILRYVKVPDGWVFLCFAPDLPKKSDQVCRPSIADSDSWNDTTLRSLVLDAPGSDPASQTQEKTR